MVSLESELVRSPRTAQNKMIDDLYWLKGVSFAPSKKVVHWLDDYNGKTESREKNSITKEKNFTC